MIELLFGVLVLFVHIVLYKIAKDVNVCLNYSQNVAESDFSKAISIIKPTKGSNEYTTRNFSSWANQNYNAPLELIFSFDDNIDPAIQIANETDAENKKITINPIKKGFTGKMSALYHGLKLATYDYLIFSDSDTRAPKNTCARIMNQFKRGAKIVTCLTRYRFAKNIWGRIYASLWNLVQIGFIVPSILKHKDQVIGNAFALSKKTLKKLGGIKSFKDYVAEDIAIGKKAKEIGVPIFLGPVIDSPVGKLKFSELMDKFSRAAMYAITMRSIKDNWRFIVIYSYIFIIISPAILLGNILFITVVILASSRLIFASYLWFIVTGEKRIFYECFIGDHLFLVSYLKSLVIRTINWGGVKYRVYGEGKMKRIQSHTPC